MNKFFSTGFACLLICFFLIFSERSFSQKTETDKTADLEKKLNLLKNKEQLQKLEKSKNLKQILKIANQIEFEKDKQKLLNSELLKIENKIVEQSRVISDISLKLSELESDIAVLSKQIESNESNLTNSKQKLANRIRSTFKEQKKYSSLSNLMALLESKKITEFSLKFKMLDMISQSDKLQIDRILFLIAKLKSDKQSVETVKIEKNKLLEENETAKNQLVLSKNEKENFVAKLIKNREFLSAEIDNRQRQMKVIEASINNLILEQKQTKETIELNKLDFKNKKGKLPWPVKKSKNNKILSKFSGLNSRYKFEIKTDGIEIKCSQNQDVYSVAEGIVIFADWIDSFGWTIIISHGSGYITLYAHLNEITVKSEQKIDGIQIIGKAGDTGSLFGTSLFFQIREGKKTVNPELWLTK